MNNVSSNQFSYEVIFELADEELRKSFNFYDIENEIDQSIREYGELNTVRHKKDLGFYIVSEKILKMFITSPVVLNTPSKALAKFTRILLKNCPILSNKIKGKRVFRSISVNIPSNELDNYSSELTLKRIIEVFCSENANTNENIILQRRIKEIVFNND